MHVAVDGGAKKRSRPPVDATPATLVSRLVRRREHLRLDTIVAPTDQPAEPDVWGLCDEYEPTDFEAMDDDHNRNAAYARAFAAVAPRRTRWLEIGCGASATLTLLALRHGPRHAHITAFEVSRPSAASAVRRLQAEECADGRVSIVVARSTQPNHEELLPPHGRRFDVLIHEVFGVVASSEGCAPMLEHARTHYLTLPRRPPRSLAALCATTKAGALGKAARRRPPARDATTTIPYRAATFFVPCELRAESLDAAETVYCDRSEAPTVLLMPCAPLDEIALSRASAVLEDHRFGASSNSRSHSRSHSQSHSRSTLGDTAMRGVQRRDASFKVARDGVLNALGVFIWVDLGLGGPSPHAALAHTGGEAPSGPPAAPTVANAATSTAGTTAGPAAAHGTVGLHSAFPFGDARLHERPRSVREGGQEGVGDEAEEGAHAHSHALNDFTSLCTPATRAARTHATNWMNPLLLLPRAVRVRRGERLHVRTVAVAASEQPSYEFTLSRLQADGLSDGQGEAIGSLRVGLAELYPDYGV